MDEGLLCQDLSNVRALSAFLEAPKIDLPDRTVANHAKCKNWGFLWNLQALCALLVPSNGGGF